MVIGACSDVVGGILRVDKFNFVWVYFGSASFDAFLEEQKSVKCQHAAVTLRSLGYHNGGLSVSTRKLIIKTFVIPWVIYELPTLTQLGELGNMENSIDKKKVSLEVMQPDSE